jgi:hypothetical protein
MNVSVRSYLSSGLAAATAGVIVVAPIEAADPAQAVAPPVALAAQVQALPISAPAALDVPALIAQQVSFNTGVAVDFIVTGAGLIGQQVHVVQTLADDIRNGTPIPAALGRVAVGLINVEVVAGHELVGFGRELVDFQIHFLGNLVSQLPPPIARPAKQALAADAEGVDNISNLANDVIDRLAQLTPNMGLARPERETSSQPSKVVALRRGNSKPPAIERDSTNRAVSATGDAARRVTHMLRDAVRRSMSTNVSNTGDDHQPRLRRARHQENAGEGNAESHKADH